MRQAINENKTAQIALVAVLLVASAFLLMTRMGGGDSAAAPATSATGASATGSTEVGIDVSVNGESAGTATAAVPDSLAAGAAGTSAAAPTSVTSEALIPGRGLPAEVVMAWKGGDAIVLLVVKPSAIDDRLVTLAAASIAARPDVSIFIVPADRIARYSRITQAVGVSQVPALVVVRPRRISGAVPQADVSYGLRSSQGVVQAVDDALYSGKDNAPYHPG